MGSISQRRQQRYRVNFNVRFGAAREFVQEYAENLSTGGLFVRGAHRLDIGEQVVIEIDLPGYDTFIVTAKVAHILSPAEAEATGRHPGAGLSITSTPDDFDQAMRDYLVRLGRRRDHMALVSVDAIRGMLEDAGYQARPLPPPSALHHVLASVEATVIALLVPTELCDHYASAAEKLGYADLVITIDGVEEFDSVLRLIDQRLDAADL